MTMTREEFLEIRKQLDLWIFKKEERKNFADLMLKEGNAYNMYYYCQQVEKIDLEYIQPLWDKLQLSEIID